MTAVLSVAALSAVAAPAFAGVFSPSAHPFMKRVLAAPTYYSFDPYKTARAQMKMVSTAATALLSAATTSSSASAITTAAAVAATLTSPKKVAAPGLSVRVGAAPLVSSTTVKALNYRVAEGDVVVVEGDRGEHIGTVKSLVLAADTEALSSSCKGKIIRRATAADLETLAAKKDKEQSCLTEVSKIAKEVRLNASIADVEYQFDNNKLTIFVERATSTTFVDFRKVQRTLFKMFHCRIWFVYMDELSF